MSLDDHTLITFTQEHSLLAVIGPVGSGKVRHDLLCVPLC